MSIFATQKKTVVIDGVNFIIKKLSLEKQLTIAALHSANKSDEAVVALISTCVDNWDAKDDAGNAVPFNIDNVKAMAADVANRLSEEIMEFNNLNRDQVKN